MSRVNDDLRAEIEDLKLQLADANDDLLADIEELQWRRQLAEGFEAVYAATGASVDRRRAQAFRSDADYYDEHLLGRLS